MKTTLAFLFALALASPATGAVVHDESVDGDLSSDPAAPTAVVFAAGANSILGSMGNVGGVDRDYVTFTIAPNQVLTGLYLVALTPDDIAFAALNAGTTSYIPGGPTIGNFLAGLHLAPEYVGNDLMPLFQTESVTTNSLPAPSLGPGSYCFVIQQTGPISQSYALDFVITSALPAATSTWGRVKALYR